MLRLGRMRRGRALVLLGLLALVALIVVARLHSGPLHRVEVRFDNAVNRGVHRHPTQVDVWKAVTTIGGPTTWRVLAGLGAVGLWFRRRRWQAVVVVIAMAGAAALSGLLKSIVGRARPTIPHPLVHAGGGSFPSGHALTSATALALLIVIADPRLTMRTRGLLIALAAVAGIAVGASRVALGVHYPSDVIGGWLVAGLWVSALHRTAGLRPRRITRAGFAGRRTGAPRPPR